jgi:hypothetical protein
MATEAEHRDLPGRSKMDRDEHRTRRVLAVTLDTFGGPSLGKAMLGLNDEEPTSFHVLVPEVEPTHGLTWTHGEIRANAEERLAVILEFTRRLGMDVDGDVTSGFSEVELERILAREHFDLVLAVQRSGGLVQWLNRSDVNKVEKEFDVPFEHIEADAPIEQDDEMTPDALRSAFVDFARSEGWDLADAPGES